MPENATENRISSAAHTQKLIANFSCPKCSKFGLKTTQSTINLFQTKVDVYCKFCGPVVSEETDPNINDLVVGSMSLCGIRDALGRRFFHGLNMPFPACVKKIGAIRKEQGPKIKK
jgi:transcription elongation factor Elf1